jgi:F-type H+-transporting ATPase subunit c
VISRDARWQGSRSSPTGVDRGLTQHAVEVARPFGFPITNSVVVTWMVTAVLVAFAQVATRQMQQVPHGAQNLLEWLVEGLYGFLEGVIGRHLTWRAYTKRTAISSSMSRSFAARMQSAGARLHAAHRRLHAARLSASRERDRLMIGNIHVALAALGAALGVGYIGAKSSEAVGRNPGSAKEVMVQSILAIAFAEAIVLYALFLAK